ncbi:MAG: nucleotide pyrophosphohydrolase [Alphaproteobacteria bacterium]|jgi:NTP pyrophosphatase (non-canonical NTP hydrolase)|nr:nucleotide pyrophosphohydrolase [Alphaproteobacteria bacterium]
MAKPLTLQTYQAAVDAWIQEIGVRYFDPLTNLGVLMEEAGEVARLIIRTDGEQSFKKGHKPVDLQEALADELADVLFCITCLANQKGIDLTAALQKNLAKKTGRDKERHANNQKLTA